MLHSQACSEMEKGFVQIPRENTDKVNVGLKSWALGIWDGIVQQLVPLCFQAMCTNRIERQSRHGLPAPSSESSRL